MKKLSRGKGKYKGKLSFKCFDYRRVRHLAKNCTMKTMNEGATTIKVTKNFRGQTKGRSFMIEEIEDDTCDESDGEQVSIHENSKGIFFLW